MTRFRVAVTSRTPSRRFGLLVTAPLLVIVAAIRWSQRRRAPGGSSPGVCWPRSQALPRFATPMRLDVLDLSGASEPDGLLAITAQGVVNRSRPRIWLLRDADEGKRTWLDTVDLPSTPVTGAEALVTRHRGEFRGAVLADAAVPATRNVATTLAGLENAVVAEPAVAERLGLP